MLIPLSIAGVLGALAIGAYITNPFNRFTIVRRPYVAKMKDGVLHAIDENKKLVINQNPFYTSFAVIKNGIHVLNSRWHKSPGSRATTVEGIMDDIYTLRFNPDKLLLTSGDHFSALFVRNLGVFYYPTLDPSIPASEERWHDRQIVYLQTLAYALGVFDKQQTITTTIVPTGRYRATCVNFHAYPSDTMYGMLYALAALLGKESARPTKYASSLHHLDTIPAAEILLSTYGPRLAEHYHKYRETVFDEATGLISLSALVSGAKDITKRKSAFYDNVVFWKTTDLAMTLGLIPTDKPFLASLKKRILSTYWLKDEGYFLEDLSEEGLRDKYYSSDWMIVLATGFLSPKKKSEREYFVRSVDYIRRMKIDEPFPIKYQHETRASRQFFIVRLAVAVYGGDAIWSFWGMEYIKILMMLYAETGDKKYLKLADRHIKSYEKNMIKNRGYPEVYDRDGNLLETPFYRSIRQTGWVVGFDQVRAMRRSL